jgi:hypothetical protein
MAPGERAEGPMQGLAWRLAASFLIGIMWLAFIIIWLFFMAGDYGLYQNLAMVILSIVVGMAALIAIWITFGLRFARQVEGVELDWEGKRDWSGWRLWATFVVWGAWLGFLVAWLFFFAVGYDAYQNVAVIIVSLVIAGGSSALLWSTLKA